MSSVEGLRCIAAVLVVTFHTQVVAAVVRGGGPPGTWLIRTGYFSVDALFILSGLCQFLGIAAAPGRTSDWRAYAIRRVMRIVPAYYLAVAVTAAYIGRFSAGTGRSGHVVGLWDVLVHLTFVQHIAYGIEGRQGFGINTAMWTLTAEAAFYCVLPLVARPFLRHPLIGLSAALGVSVAWRALAIAAGGAHGPSVYLVSQAPAFAFEFALGMTAAVVIVRLRRVIGAGQDIARHVRAIATATVVWGVAALLAWQRASDPAHHGLSQSFTVYDRFVWNLAPATAFAILIVGLALCPPSVAWPWSNRVVRWVGETTYGTYLFHTIVMLEVAHRWKALGHHPLALWQIGPAVVFESVLVGRLSFLFVEEPARRFARRHSARRSRATATAVVPGVAAQPAAPVEPSGGAGRDRAQLPTPPTTPGGAAGWAPAPSRGFGVGAMARVAAPAGAPALTLAEASRSR